MLRKDFQNPPPRLRGTSFIKGGIKIGLGILPFLKGVATGRGIFPLQKDRWASSAKCFLQMMPICLPCPRFMFRSIRSIRLIRSIVLVALLFFFGATSTVHASVVSGAPSTSITRGLVGWWTLDGADLKNNVADRSGLGNTGYMQGFTSTSSAKVAGKIGQALKFDGVGSYVDIPFISNFTPTGTYTVSMWFKSVNTSGSLFEMSNISSNRHSINFYVNKIRAGTWDGSGHTGKTSTNTVSKNVWHHIVFVNNTGTISMYLDNTSQTVNSFAGTSSGISQIGYGDGSGYFNGQIDDVRIYNRALSASEVKHLYSMGATKFAVPTSADNPNLNAGLVGWWTMDGKDLLTNVADKSGSGNTGYMQGFTSTSSAKVAGKMGQALKFDGVDDYVNIPVSDANYIGPLTISAWVYFNKGSTYHVIAVKGDANDYGSPIGLPFEFYTSNGATPVLSFLRAATNACNTRTGPSISIKKWHHVVASTNSTNISGTVTFYVDGIATTGTWVNCGGTGSGTVSGNNKSIRIGKSTALINGNGGLQMNGNIDDLRIYNRALSAKEVKELYLLGR